MCGILACFGSTRPQEELDAVLVELSKTLTHRGPDESGYRSFQLSGAGGLAHTRLSIMDPEHGHQPLVNADGENIAVLKPIRLTVAITYRICNCDLQRGDLQPAKAEGGIFVEIYF